MFSKKVPSETRTVSPSEEASIADWIVWYCWGTRRGIPADRLGILRGRGTVGAGKVAGRADRKYLAKPPSLAGIWARAVQQVRSERTSVLGTMSVVPPSVPGCTDRRAAGGRFSGGSERRGLAGPRSFRVIWKDAVQNVRSERMNVLPGKRNAPQAWLIPLSQECKERDNVRQLGGIVKPDMEELYPPRKCRIFSTFYTEHRFSGKIGEIMRTRFRFLAAGLLALPWLAAGQVFTTSPPSPLIGADVTLTFDGTASGATLGGKSSLRGEAFLMLDSDAPVRISFPMSKSGVKWTGSFPLTDDRTRLILFRVVADKEEDAGDGNAPFVMVYGSNGKPLMGANLQRASLMLGGGFMEFKHAKDFAGAYAAFSNEKELYPDNWRVYPLEWNAMMRENRGEETAAKVKTALEGYYERFKGNGDALAAVLPWFDKTGQKERGEAITKAAIEAAPTGPVAEATRRGALLAERDMTKRAELIEKFLADFPQKGAAKDQMINIQISALMGAKQVDKALAVLEKAPTPNANMLNAVAWEWIEKGENLAQAVEIAKRGVELALNPPPGAKPTYYSDEMWKSQTDYSAAMVLDTYGFGLYKLGRYVDAESALQQAYGVNKGEEPDITERLLMVLNQNGKYDKAMEVGKSAVRLGKTTDKLIEYYRTAYTKVKGSDKGFDASLSDTKAVGAKDAKEKMLKSRIGKPAIQFALKDMTGATVRLANLKGKVVVLDFWATWCGPCKSSFPTLQKVFETYRKNPSVKILALDTWENVSGKEREALVKKFIADNKYTFPVLFDEGYVEKYGVEGIPTKFVIDRKGNLAFKSVGFSGGEEMMRELTTQIDILLAETP
jgi:thiol-disulfide isomerase/thioredoxin